MRYPQTPSFTALPAFLRYVSYQLGTDKWTVARTRAHAKALASSGRKVILRSEFRRLTAQFAEFAKNTIAFGSLAAFFYLLWCATPGDEAFAAEGAGFANSGIFSDIVPIVLANIAFVAFLFVLRRLALPSRDRRRNESLSPPVRIICSIGGDEVFGDTGPWRGDAA